MPGKTVYTPESVLERHYGGTWKPGKHNASIGVFDREASWPVLELLDQHHIKVHCADEGGKVSITVDNALDLIRLAYQVCELREPANAGKTVKGILLAGKVNADPALTAPSQAPAK